MSVNSTYWLTNTRLETSYLVNEGKVTGTNSENFNLLIKDKKITKIIAASEEITDNLPQKDAKQLLAQLLLLKNIVIWTKPY